VGGRRAAVHQERSQYVEDVSYVCVLRLCSCGVLCMIFCSKIPLLVFGDMWAKGFLGQFYGLC